MKHRTTHLTVFDTSKLKSLTNIFPWGEHKGKSIDKIPGSYLLWLMERAERDQLRPEYLNKLVRDEWNKRTKEVAEEAKRIIDEQESKKKAKE